LVNAQIGRFKDLAGVVAFATSFPAREIPAAESPVVLIKLRRSIFRLLFVLINFILRDFLNLILKSRQGFYVGRKSTIGNYLVPYGTKWAMNHLLSTHILCLRHIDNSKFNQFLKKRT
jgi:hypothetical protein